MFITRRFGLVTALLLLSASAFAIPVTYTFSGYINRSEIQQLDTWPSPPDLGIGVGTTFTGVLNYDADALVCGVSAPSYICVSQHATPSWTVSFGDFVLSSTGPHVRLGDDTFNTQFGANGFQPATFDGWKLITTFDVYLGLLAAEGTAPLLDPLVPPVDLDKYTQGGSWFTNAYMRPDSKETDGLQWDVGGKITSFQRVPEPATLGTFAVALLGLFATSRRRHQKRSGKRRLQLAATVAGFVSFFPLASSAALVTYEFDGYLTHSWPEQATMDNTQEHICRQD